MNKRRVLLWVVTVCLLAVLIPSTVFAANDGWVSEGGNWYYYENGEKICDTIHYIDHACYGFDENGVMYSAEWVKREDGWHYYKADGKMCFGCVCQIDGKYYGFNYDGVMQVDSKFVIGMLNEDQTEFVEYMCRAKADGTVYMNEWYKDKNGDWYYYGAEGKGADDFTKIDNTWYFFEDAKMIKDKVVWSGIYQSYFCIGKDGKSSTKAPAYGWCQAGDDYYYFGSNHWPVTGWQSISGKWYFFKDNGKMATGWVHDGSDWYYLDGNGQYQNGWQLIGGNYYHFAANGKMSTGWLKLGGYWYYFASSGKMTTGWLKSGADWYYFYSGGKMAVGWVQSGTNWYYMNGSGKMVTGWLKSGGDWYYFRSGGQMAVGWVQDGANWYYMNASGKMLVGEHVINNITYTFNEKGIWIG